MITVKQGIDQETAKKVVKAIKENPVKVQATIQGEQIRVTGKKRDDLSASDYYITWTRIGFTFAISKFSRLNIVQNQKGIFNE